MAKKDFDEMGFEQYAVFKRKYAIFDQDKNKRDYFVVTDYDDYIPTIDQRGITNITARKSTKSTFNYKNLVMPDFDKVYVGKDLLDALTFMLTQTDVDK